MYDGNLRKYNLISIENENIQLQDSLYTDNSNTLLDKELRSILNTIKDNKFNNTVHWNSLFNVRICIR